MKIERFFYLGVSFNNSFFGVKLELVYLLKTVKLMGFCWQYSQFVYTDLRFSKIENNLNSYAADGRETSMNSFNQIEHYHFCVQNLRDIRESKALFSVCILKMALQFESFYGFHATAFSSDIYTVTEQQGKSYRTLHTHELQLNLNDFLKLLDLHLLRQKSSFQFRLLC